MTVAGIVMGGLLLSVIVFLGLGFMIKGLKSSGIIRRNFLLISIGSIFFCIFGLLEGLTVPGLFVILVRVGYLCSFWFMYFGLQTKE
jgi:hypothetical protein